MATVCTSFGTFATQGGKKAEGCSPAKALPLPDPTSAQSALIAEQIRTDAGRAVAAREALTRAGELSPAGTGATVASSPEAGTAEAIRDMSRGIILDHSKTKARSPGMADAIKDMLLVRPGETVDNDEDADAPRNRS